LNYRHIFHAGNHGDVLKHAALVFCLDAWKRKQAAFAVMDTHAGRGGYDLTSDEARRGGEWPDGVGKLIGWGDAPAPVRAYLEAGGLTGAAAPRFYPGSPKLIASALRAQDRLVACELHEEEFAALRRMDFGDAKIERPRIELHRRDGYEALGALLPFPERRGLVLIDPPYEQPGEMARVVAAIKAGLSRFGHGVFLWWRPLKRGADLDRADGELAHPGLRADLWIDTPALEGKLVGSSLYVINPPFGLGDALGEALPALAKRLALGPGAGWRLDGA
jgi:23S rRNA (adenine2030-N6)-methyltransferase